jgi:hypothetical protein
VGGPSPDPANANSGGQAVSGPLASHSRIASVNPLVERLAAGADPKAVVPDSTVIVRGGQNYVPQPGDVISAQMGADVPDAASGLPHGTIRVATAGEIRATGGMVELAPEPAWDGGPTNTWHVNVTEGPQPAFPAQSVPNPVTWPDRLKRP